MSFQDIPNTRKSLGQHWLNDLVTLENICSCAHLSNDDVVLEIGPGPGSLTRLLVSKVSQVVAIELDNKLANELLIRLPVKNLKVINTDILSFDFRTLPDNYKVVANIPYYLTSHLIRVLSEAVNRPTVAVLLIQKEVAMRVAAQPGQMSLLSVTAQFYWQVSLGQVVPASLFKPAPKVDSQILRLSARAQPLFKNIDSKDFFRLVKAGFAQKRKTLLNSLGSGLGINRADTEKLCQKAQIDSTRRAQTLSLDDWYKLYLAANT
ncbi:MAG: 16S rRNA (adenine(1518)-N(6)/adenine(1519)-N(6)) -dimethyltransferase RsmA [Candidatus Saccharimonadales bacterium]